MLLNKDNYFEPAMNMKYMSVSQYKRFTECEGMAMAMLKGEYIYPSSISMLVGSYVDAHFEGSLDEFITRNPLIFTQKGTLRSEYKKANEIIKRIERDELFMQFLSGEKQTIFIGELFGIEWKVKIDSYISDKCIVDLKTLKDMRFIDKWRYDIQGAVYQAIVKANTGKKLPFYLSIATKETVTDIDIFQIPNYLLKQALEEIEENILHIMDVKNGEVEPEYCGVCDYCKTIKKATIRDYTDLLQ